MDCTEKTCKRTTLAYIKCSDAYLQINDTTNNTHFDLRKPKPP